MLLSSRSSLSQSFTVLLSVSLFTSQVVGVLSVEVLDEPPHPPPPHLLLPPPHEDGFLDHVAVYVVSDVGNVEGNAGSHHANVYPHFSGFCTLNGESTNPVSVVLTQSTSNVNVTSFAIH